MSYIRDFGRWLQAHGHADAYVLSGSVEGPVRARPSLPAEQTTRSRRSSPPRQRLDAHSPWRWQAVAFFTLMHSLRAADRGNPRCCDPNTSTCATGHLDVVCVQGQPQPPAAADRRGHRGPGRLRPDIAARFGPSRRTFFVSATGNQVTAATVGKMFNRIWDQAGLPRPAGGQQPRPYDFRHHFAYANIERWMAQGNDVTAMLPYLARYMGHASIESTYYYIHTSPDFMHAYAAHHRREPVAAAGGRVRMKRDPKTGAPDFYGFARDYLHTYLPTVAATAHRKRSRPTGSAWNASSHYLADHEHIDRAHVSFDHFDRPHLKGWLAWMSRPAALRAEDHRAAAEHHQSVPDLRCRRRHHPRRAQPGSQGPTGPGQRRGSRSSTSPNPRHAPCSPRSPAAPRNHAGTGCC